MVELADLWLPIVLSGVFVFLVSSVVHMASPLHKNDFKGLPSEDEALATLRKLNLAPGEYMFPRCTSMKDMKSPEFMKRMEQGPTGTLMLRRPGPISMGPALLQWFLFSLVISLFAAYLGSLSLPLGADYKQVFRVTGTVAVLGYCVTNVTNSIWKGSAWSTTFKFIFDGVIYGLVTAGTFGWLWPAAS